MDKQTLSNYGWIVICVLVLAVMIALATPFGTFVKTAAENTTEELFQTEKTAMSVAGLNIDDQSFNPPRPLQEIFDEETAGQTRPNSFIYGDYEYYYNKQWSGSSWTNSSFNGWGVHVLDKTKSSYGEILTSAYGQPVNNLHFTFLECASLTTAPEIPSSVTNMMSTFTNCTSLTTAPEIPSGVTNMSGTFYGCTSLTTAPEIPSSVTNMSYTFTSCTSLTTATTIPSSVTDMSSTFYNCILLTGTITVNANPTNYSSCFVTTGPINNYKPIILTGSSTMLSQLAATANKNNVTVG